MKAQARSISSTIRLVRLEKRNSCFVSLPPREDRYIGEPVLAVFENLLPDNDEIRRRVAERSHAEGSDTYSLLSAIGRDCAGGCNSFPKEWRPAPPERSIAVPSATKKSRG